MQLMYILLILFSLAVILPQKLQFHKKKKRLIYYFTSYTPTFMVVKIIVKTKIIMYIIIGFETSSSESIRFGFFEYVSIVVLTRNIFMINQQK